MSSTGMVLVIDDDPDICTYVSEVLKDNDFETATAVDGMAGLVKAREARPDLIVLDLMMPKKSGIRFLNEVKLDPALSEIPIIVLSGATRVTGVDMKHYLEEQPFKERKGKVPGVAPDTTPDAYLDKPVDPVVLVGTVKKLLER
jgi:two-component system phosphate regulon response regulator PhoB